MSPGLTAVSSGDSPLSSAECSFRELDDVSLQTQTRIWLGEVLSAILDEQLDISELLADGELLFEVSNVIWNMLLEKCVVLRHVKRKKPVSSRKSSGRYMPYSNVDSFLNICKILGMNGIDLFSPSDVVEKKNIRKVCICIRSLSKKARSKQLCVPDFDIVPYPVTMSTNMVGCIRRSLEQSRCSSTKSSSYSSYKNSRVKYRQQNSGISSVRNCDSCSEESDEAESNYLGNQSYSSSSNSCDDAFAIHSVSENSRGVYFATEKYTPMQGHLQSDIEDKERLEFKHGQQDSSCLAESRKSLCLHSAKNDPLLGMSSSRFHSQKKLGDGLLHVNNRSRNRNENTKFNLEGDLGSENNDSIVMYARDGNGAEISYNSPLAFPGLTAFETDMSHHLMFGDDSVFDLFIDTDSNGGSSRHRIFQNRFKRCDDDDDDVEDAEVSSITSMTSVLGRVLNLDFDDTFDADDLRTSTIDNVDWFNSEVDDLNKRCVLGHECHNTSQHEAAAVHSFASRSEEAMLDAQLKNLSFPTKWISPCLDFSRSDVTENKNIKPFSNEICISGRDSADANVVIVNELDNTQRKNGEEKMVNDASLTEDVKHQMKQNEVDILAEEILNDTKDLSADRRPHRKPLVRAVVEGTALIGVVVLLLLRLRRNTSSRGERGEANKQSNVTDKWKGVKLPEHQEQNGGEAKGAYPAEKLKF